MKLAKETALYNEGAVEQVSETADTAKTIATNTAQYFWTSSDGTDNGAHITENPKEQFESNPSGGNLLATTNGIAVRDGLTERAKFGETVVIGETTNTHQEMDYHSLKLIDKEGNTYFYVSDLRNWQTINGQTVFVADMEMIIIAESSGDEVEIQAPPYSIETTSVTVNSENVAIDIIIDNLIYLTQFYSAGDIIKVTYKTDSPWAKAYTLGMRRPERNIGAHSTAEGYNTTASGTPSHAEGDNTTASGTSSHAEGTGTTASGFQSHAEGRYTTASGFQSHAEGDNTTASRSCSHAEGYNTTASGNKSHAEGYGTTASESNSHAEGYYTTASGYCSHAEGYTTTANGGYSHAQNLYTKASSTSQTAIGKYNKEDTAEQYGFIIGNGTADNARSNALTVDWNGNEVIAGTLTQSSDRRLKKHVAYLDEDAVEFIRKLKPAHFVKDEEDHVGFYAQDVEKEDKWNCMTGEMNGYKTLGYTEIIAPLVAYCQHLEARINELERKQNG
jgi:hypothetical protein